MDAAFARLLDLGSRPWTRPYPSPRKTRLRKLLDDYEVIEKFRQLKNDEKRLTYAIELVLQNDMFEFDSDREAKDTQHSIESREDGNKSFKSGRDNQAVQKYTESIVYATDSSEELALAYADRSAALFKLEKFEECIKDIDRALSLKYPDRLKTKVYQRKGLCLKALGTAGFESSFREALVWLEKLGMSEEQINKTRTKLQDECISLPITKALVNPVQYPVPKITTPNPEIPSASDAVTIEYSDQFGRHLVATRKIEPGELLILEKPYYSRLKYEYVYSHCSHCLQESWSLIPCKCCVKVAYCSDTCKDTAWDKYHEVECIVMRLLEDFNLEYITWISMNMAIMATQKGTKMDSLREEVTNADCNTDPRTKGFTNDGKFDNSQHRSLYSLMNTAEEFPIKSIIMRSLSVALAVCIVGTHTNTFGDKLTLNTLLTNPDVIFLGELMLKHMHIGCANIHSYEVCGVPGKLASGLLPLCSLLNHSCDANTSRSWYIDHMTVHAIHPIEQGEQIFDNYGARFPKMTKYERDRHLEHWKFTCRCRPCIEDWPTLWYMPSYKEKTSNTVTEITLDFMMWELKTTYDNLIQNVNVENLVNMLNELLNAIGELFRLGQRPCKELCMIVMIVQEFYWSGFAIFDYEPNSAGCEIMAEPTAFYKQLDILLSKIEVPDI